MIDAAGLGALIGISVMTCLTLVVCCNDRKEYLVTRWKQYRQLKQPLLPVTVKNPVLVRTPSKQFQMKEILTKK